MYYFGLRVWHATCFRQHFRRDWLSISHFVRRGFQSRPQLRLPMKLFSQSFFLPACLLLVVATASHGQEEVTDLPVEADAIVQSRQSSADTIESPIDSSAN